MRTFDPSSPRPEAISSAAGSAQLPTETRPLDGPDSPYVVDGLAPRQVSEPSTAAHLANDLRAADEEGAAVVPWGGGEHMTLGNRPSRYNLALRTTKLNRLVEHEPPDMTITVEAGMTVNQLQTLLREHGQFLPIDAPPRASIGGMIAAGVTGPSSHAYGLPRDWLIGCKLALTDGTLVKGGGRVVKNVAGYDLPKLVVGSLGTLGIVIEATFKLAPLPQVERTLLVEFRSLEDALTAISASQARGLALRAVALSTSNVANRFTAAFWLAGRERAVARSELELEDVTQDGNSGHLDGEASEQRWRTLVSPYRLVDGCARLQLSVPPSRVSAVLEALAHEAGVSSTAYPATGQVVVDSRSDVRLIERVRSIAGLAGGTAVVLTASADVKARIDAWGDAGGAISVMRRLKDEFDPRGTLNPGRYVGGI